MDRPPPRIITHYDPPPIPTNQFNWSAIDDATHDENSPTGYGETEAAAIADLLEKLEV
jgi:hypothetical protein